MKTNQSIAISSITVRNYRICLAIAASQSGSPSMCLACDQLEDNITLTYVGQLSQAGGDAAFADR